MFPEAKEVQKKGIDDILFYFFEEDLRSILKLIGDAKRFYGVSFVYVKNLSPAVSDFLIGKGYRVSKTEDYSIVFWGEEDYEEK